MPSISVLGKRQEDQFKASLSYLVNSSQPGLHDNQSQNPETNKIQLPVVSRDQFAVLCSSSDKAKGYHVIVKQIWVKT